MYTIDKIPALGVARLRDQYPNLQIIKNLNALDIFLHSKSLTFGIINWIYVY